MRGAVVQSIKGFHFSRRRFGSVATKRPVSTCSRTSSVLFLATIWPEHSSSAAGVRTSELVQGFRRWGWSVDFACSAVPNRYTTELEESGVRVHVCPPNKADTLKAVIDTCSPGVVVFDRFSSEEAFSFRVRELSPDSLRVLDMQDFHSLRRARQRVIELGGGVDEAIAALPVADDAMLVRELASLHRCDLNLVCSSTETRLLANHYRVPQHKLVSAPFFCDQPLPAASLMPFGDRFGFATIGTLRHPPNVDCLRWIKAEVWPKIRTALPNAEFSAYGEGPGSKVSQLHDPKQGFHIRGYAPSLSVLDKHRVLLAPLRYGAGIKGKILDAWSHGLPVVTTPIGAEGTTLASGDTGGAAANEDDNDWGGLWRLTDSDSVARAAVSLHEDEPAWVSAQGRGLELLGDLFDRDRNLEVVRKAITAARANLPSLRACDFEGAMLWHHTARSTEFFSRWIELKEASKAD